MQISASRYVDQFQMYWEQFSEALKLNTQLSHRLYSTLLQAYSEPQRAYHTVQHIVECLDLFHRIADELDDPIAVETAIWFHDVIYNPQSSDNEVESAQLMLDQCATFLDAERLHKIYAWILATKHHKASQVSDLNYLLDIDLAILGSAQKRFAEYEQQIRYEYNWVEAEIYRLKRMDVLKHFYDMKPLYQTAYFQERFEDQAKANLFIATR